MILKEQPTDVITRLDVLLNLCAPLLQDRGGTDYESGSAVHSHESTGMSFLAPWADEGPCGQPKTGSANQT